MSNKVIFFDVDGTLVNSDGVFPESAQNALRQAQANGHSIVLCSGRSKCQIDDRLLNFGFDGLIGGTGAYVEYQGKVVSEDNVTPEQLTRVITYLEEKHMTYMLQTTEGIVTTVRGHQEIVDFYHKCLGDELPVHVNKILENQAQDDALLDHVDQYKVEKLCYYLSDIPLEQVAKDLGEAFTVTAMSFEKFSKGSGEITITGIDKAHGMERLIQYLGVNPADTIAFGDGPNDFEMIEFAGVGVAMGNAVEDLKAKADRVTADIDEDGILRGMQELQLI
ncbi:MAG: Cof-type HAD-IIB family hydrolase [Lachnospiraceae bacterium]|nr:Cof-type HAD-IIB family hydrolase [Lachnospiraceae bacterium]